MAIYEEKKINSQNKKHNDEGKKMFRKKNNNYLKAN